MIDFPSEYLKERCKFDFGNKIERMIDTEDSIITFKKDMCQFKWTKKS